MPIRTDLAPAFRPQTNLAELRSLMAGHTDRKDEARILTLFHEASAGELA